MLPHPATIKNYTVTEIKEMILNLNLHSVGEVRASRLAERLWRAHSVSYPAVSEDSFVVKQLQHQTENIINWMIEREVVVKEMIHLAHDLPEFEILKSIPGIAENTAVRLIGGLGDIRRFEKRSQLNSYIGIDLVEIQSGDYTASRKKPLLVRAMDRLIKTIHYLVLHNQFYLYELARSL